MSRVLLLEPEAVGDLATEFVKYETLRLGLGSRFLVEVAAALDRIERFPEQYRIVRGSTRRAKVRRFPYFVSYIVAANEIAVTSVMHGSRDRQT